MVNLNQFFQSRNYFVIRDGQSVDIQAQHSGNHIAEVDQLEMKEKKVYEKWIKMYKRERERESERERERLSTILLSKCITKDFVIDM